MIIQYKINNKNIIGDNVKNHWKKKTNKSQKSSKKLINKIKLELKNELY